MAQGKKTGGRKKGSINRKTKLKQKLTSGLPVEKGVAFAELVLDGKVPCGVCHGKGKTKFQPKRKKIDGLWVDGVSDMEETSQKLGERTCQSCYGSGLERLSPGERLRAALELIEYGYAKKKAVDITNSDGSMRPSWAVVVPDVINPNSNPSKVPSAPSR